jgi:hypothetical protein
LLSALDETLRHQLPTTFDHVWTSDPRQFDRYWFSAYDPAGRAQLICGMGLYSNMNVQDGFAALMLPRADGSGVDQHNFRVSRALRPDIDETRVGPLSIEIAKPYQQMKLRWREAGHPLRFEIDWEAGLPAVEEEPHFQRNRGRVVRDYRRYTQVGSTRGFIELRGQRFEVDGWGGRDHSWGVRDQTAGPEPVTGESENPTAKTGFGFFWLPWLNDEFGGHVQIQMLGNGTKVYQHGEIIYRDGRRLRIVDAELEAEFHDGCNYYKRVHGVWRAADGQRFEFESVPLVSHWSMDGTGYDYGWNDEKGLGWYRGEYFAESDVYDLSNPAYVLRPDGSRRTPGHREAPARVTINGKVGTGHQVFLIVQPCPYFGR